MGSPTRISSGDCDPAPPALLDDSATSEGAAAAGALSSMTRLCLGTGPGLKSDKDVRQQKPKARQKPPDWLLDIVTGPPLPHSCPRLLGTTSAGFGSGTPLTSQRFDSSRLTLHQVCKGNTIIGVRTLQSLQNSWIQIRPIIMRLQMSTRHHMARLMNLWQWRITPIDQQIILQKDPESAKTQKDSSKEPDVTELCLFWRIIHMQQIWKHRNGANTFKKV